VSKAITDLSKIAADEAAYQAREKREYARQLRAPNAGTVAEKQESTDRWVEAIGDHPEIIAERVGWLFDGSYGYGSYRAAWALLESDEPCTDQVIAIISALEWMVPEAYYLRAMKRVPADQLARLRVLVSRVVDRERNDPGRPVF
jgi:hypothetical protein